ncbi:MAG TPA: hypothetical protein DCZ92_14350 [Elusimicrobia bacterium]|nr:MAG: hypothetical protein A2016_08940 [Elusimicrobia bacterium GWF2_62_30]HBA61964.1 hypothetical protein [Elusimicrobiota bacterium]
MTTPTHVPPAGEKKPPLSRPAARKALALALGIIFALFSAEAALRLGGFFYRASQEKRNSLAVGREGYRIMCLGESTTAGGKGSWPFLLEDTLAKRYPALRFSVVNKGVPAVNTTDILRELEKNLDEVRPDLVIAMMGMNDGFVRYYEGVSDPGSPLFRHLRVYKLFKLLLNKEKAERPLPVRVAPQVSRAPALMDPYGPYHDGTLDITRHEKELLQKIERDPRDAASLYLLGRYWVLHKSWRETGTDQSGKGKDLLLRAEKLEPNNSFVAWTLGMYYLLIRNDAGRGLPYLQKAAELNPTGENWTYLGRAYKFQGRREKAEAAMLRALAPENPLEVREEAILELSWMYIADKDYLKAEKLLQKARSLDPYNEKVSGALASLYTESGRPALAAGYAQKLSSTRALFTYKTRTNFRELRRILKERGIRLAVMQYPLCDPAPLKALFEEPGDIIFIANERTFRKAVNEKGYTYYFQDMFAGNFGHCTGAGNELIAANAADALAGYLGR